MEDPKSTQHPTSSATDAAFLDLLALRDLPENPDDLEDLAPLELQENPEPHPSPLANRRPHLHANLAHKDHQDRLDHLELLVIPERLAHPADLESMPHLVAPAHEDPLDQLENLALLALLVNLASLPNLSH